MIHFDDFRFYCNSDQAAVAPEAYISHFHQMATITALRILTWIFPWQMAVFELLLRLSVHAPAPTGFIGPTIGAASLGMILPLTRAREQPQRGGADERYISFDRREEQLAQLATLAIWTGFNAWAFSLYLSLNPGGDLVAGLDTERSSHLIGLIIWVTVVLFDLVRGGSR